MLGIATGAFARYRAVQLEYVADDLGARSREAAASFAATFQEIYHDTELRFMAARGEHTRRASLWAHAGLYLFGLSVLLLLAAWVAYELKAFSELAAEVPDPRKGKDGAPPAPK